MYYFLGISSFSILFFYLYNKKTKNAALISQRKLFPKATLEIQLLASWRVMCSWYCRLRRQHTLSKPTLLASSPDLSALLGPALAKHFLHSHFMKFSDFVSRTISKFLPAIEFIRYKIAPAAQSTLHKIHISFYYIFETRERRTSWEHR